MNSNRGWKIYNKMPRDIQDLMSVYLMNNTKEYFRNNVASYLIEKAKKKYVIRYIINFYKKRYKILTIEYIYNLLERDLLKYMRYIFGDNEQFEIFINKIFNDKNIDNIQEIYKSEIVVNKILINLSFDNIIKFKKINTLN